MVHVVEAGGRPCRLKNQIGQTLPLFALVAPVLLAFMAIGLDAAQAFLERRDAQGAADLAALAGARLLHAGATPTEQDEARARARSIAGANGYPSAQVTVTTPYAGHDERILVTIDAVANTFFMPVLELFAPGDHTRLNVDARAVAHSQPASVPVGNYALFSLQPCGSKEDYKALEWSGSENIVEGNVHSSSGLLISGNSNIIRAQTGETESKFSVTCVGTSGMPTNLRITDKYPYNESGTNPVMTDGGSDNGLVPADCTGTEPPGRVCRQVVPPSDIPFYDEASRTLDLTSMAASCTTTWTGSPGDTKAVTPSLITAPGVYCFLNGTIEIKTGSYAHPVTFFAREVKIADGPVSMTSYLNGILMYATTTEAGKGIIYSVNNGSFTGILYSPMAESLVSFSGEGNVLTGALVGYHVVYGGNRNKLIGVFASQTSTPATVALIE